jgi:hypothetical protein
LLASVLEAQGGHVTLRYVTYNDLLIRSKKTENNVARMSQMENKNHWSDNRKRTDQLEKTPQTG